MTEGTGLRAFLIDNNDSLHKISIAKLERLHRYDDKERMMEFAGKRVRYAMVFLETLNRKPAKIITTQYSILTFNDQGQLDKKEIEAETRLAIDLMDEDFFPEEKTPGVINARKHFLKRQICHKYKWEPTPEIEEEIARRIFGKG